MTAPRPPRLLIFLLFVAAATTTLLLVHYGFGFMNELVFVNSVNVLVVSVILGIVWYVGDFLVRKVRRVQNRRFADSCPSDDNVQ